MSDISVWFNQMPVITRHWFAGSVLLPLLSRIGLLPYSYLYLTSNFLTSFEIWRPITAVFYYPISPKTGFQFLINLFMLYNYSLRLETENFAQRPADYAFLLLFNWTALLLIAIFTNTYLLMTPMILSVIYVWCQFNKEMIVRFWFNTQFKAMYLPWVIFGFNLIINGGGMDELIGILVGHLYHFLMFTYPQENNRDPIFSTPRFLNQWFQTPSAPRTGYMQGRGYSLR